MIITDRGEIQARDIWMDLSDRQVRGIANRFGYTRDDLYWLQWKEVPEEVKQYVREVYL